MFLKGVRVSIKRGYRDQIKSNQRGRECPLVTDQERMRNI